MESWAFRRYEAVVMRTSRGTAATNARIVARRLPTIFDSVMVYESASWE